MYWLQDLRGRQVIDDKQLSEAENEMQRFYEIYCQKREELGQLILAYEEKKKDIKIRIKNLKRLDEIIKKDSHLITSEMKLSKIIQKAL